MGPVEMYTEQLKLRLKESMSHWVALPDDAGLYRDKIKEVLSQNPMFDPVAFEAYIQVNGNVLDINPMNLYAFLVLNGQFVNPDIVRYKHEYTNEYGTWGSEDGQWVFRAAKPISHISVEITISE